MLPAVALMFWAARRQAIAKLKKIADESLHKRLTEHLSEKKTILRNALLLAAIFFAVLALARPQLDGRSTLVKKEGIDILFAIDVSKSMLVRDIRPSRLERAKLEIRAIIEELKGDRVGIVSFAGAAFVQCPLTTDYAASRLFLKSLSPNDMPVMGTAIGEALNLSHKLLTSGDSPAGSRLVVLLTDGEDHGEAIKEAMVKLEEDDIPVFVVGIGSHSGEPIPDYDQRGRMTGYHKDTGGQTVMSRLNEKVLKRVADHSGGEYLNLQSGGTMEALHRYIEKMQKQEFESSLYTQYDEKFHWLLWPAFLFLLLATFIDERRGTRGFGVLK